MLHNSVQTFECRCTTLRLGNTGIPSAHAHDVMLWVQATYSRRRMERIRCAVLCTMDFHLE